MQSTAQMRVSIKPYLQDYIQQKADELGITDVSEVVNLLILDHKRGLLPTTSLSIPQAMELPKVAVPRSELDEFSELF